MDPKPTVGISQYSAFNSSPILVSDPLGDTSKLGTRVMGALNMVGGVLEMGAGSAGGAATSWSGIGLFAGGTAVAHGADVTSSAAMQLWTGEETQTFTSRGISKGLQAVGVSKIKADKAGEFGDMGLSMMLTAGGGYVAAKDATKVAVRTPMLQVVKAEAQVAKAEAEAAKVEMTTVGRWMSRAEYDAMKAGGRMMEGAGGKTSVATGGFESFPAAAKGSVYAEFQVPTNSLIQGGQSNWFSILGPNASKSQLFMLQKQGGEILPKIQNLSPIIKIK